MTKRADRRTGGFFPESERPEGQRYAARGPDPKWTPAQEATLAAAVCACRSRAAYLGMAAPLMEALGHPPTYPESALPHPAKHANTCLRALELKLITKMLGGYGGWTPHTLMGFHLAASDEWPLTWGQKVKVIRPYVLRTVGNRRAGIFFGQLLQILGRTQSKAVAEYMDRLSGPPFVDEEDNNAKPPVRPDNQERLFDLVASLDQCLRSKETWKDKDSINRLLGVPE